MTVRRRRHCLNWRACSWVRRHGTKRAWSLNWASFATCSPEVIADGMQRLSDLIIREHMAAAA